MTWAGRMWNPGQEGEQEEQESRGIPLGFLTPLKPALRPMGRQGVEVEPKNLKKPRPLLPILLGSGQPLLADRQESS